MVRADLLVHVVEVNEIAGADIHGTQAEAYLTGVDQVEIDELLKRVAKRARLVHTERACRTWRETECGWNARLEKTRQAEHRSGEGARLVEKRPPVCARNDRLRQ